MTGHVAVWEKSVLDFEQHIAGPAYKNAAERMITVGARSFGDVEAQPQKSFVVERRQFAPLQIAPLRGIATQWNQKKPVVRADGTLLA